MKFILIDSRSGKSRSFSANGLVISLAVAGLIGIPAVTGIVGYDRGIEVAGISPERVARWQDELDIQRQQVTETRARAAETLQASTLRLAKLQARIVRLDALGERLTSVGKLDQGEFDFSSEPAVGGPGSLESSEPYEVQDFIAVLDRLAGDIDDREQQLSVLEMLLADRKIQSDVFIAGRPIDKGWMSSHFGKRTDPITGRKAWHNGVDFAGQEGDDIKTVAAGVVVHSGSSNGYGKMVEVNHGGGFSTRYGHQKTLLVKVGDIVKKGQIVGLMGSSGRSTGPHVHFEVYKNGRIVDPSSYIHRAAR
jgi:murein DD-endopeptidase MepM/ murein hydrolase activator NlpD